MNESFNHYLRRIGVEADVRSLLYHISRACKYINFSLRAGGTDYLETENSSGETQLALDVEADKIIAGELAKSELCATFASEEREHPESLPCPRGAFTVAYDPLDGSSLFDSNLSIGSIFGIWEGDELLGQTGNDLVASVYCVYGPKVLLIIAARDCGAHMFEMNDVGEFVLNTPNLKLADGPSKYFAPGNLRATITDARYRDLLNTWIDQGRTLRYSGGMVPDIHHMLCKGQGVFAYPPDQKHTQGKLRLAFECHPMAHIITEAGGYARTTDDTCVLGTPITAVHQRVPIIMGCRADVQHALTFFGHTNPAC